MDVKYTLSANALFSLIDSVGNPNPDDTGTGRGPWGPYGPGGPVMNIASMLSAFEEVMLNPQPLPPRSFADLLSPHPEPWSSGPSPDPWRAAMVARFTAAQMVAQLQLARTVAGTEQNDRLAEQFRANLRELTDEWCGTPSGHRPPRPHGLSPVELIAAGAQFAGIADGMSGHALQGDFTNAANQLVETAMSQLEQGGGAGGASG